MYPTVYNYFKDSLGVGTLSHWTKTVEILNCVLLTVTMCSQG